MRSRDTIAFMIPQETFARKGEHGWPHTSHMSCGWPLMSWVAPYVTAAWTLRQWGQQAKILVADAELMKVKDRGERRWYVNGQGQTFAVIKGPVRTAATPSRFEFCYAMLCGEAAFMAFDIPSAMQKEKNSFRLKTISPGLHLILHGLRRASQA